METKTARKLKMGMVGGGKDAFIGGVHRTAAIMDGTTEFAAGALSSTPEKARESGRALALPDDRNYGSWEEMIERELARPAGERIDFVSIVTPNHMHFPVAKAFVEAGFNVVLDKPMVQTGEQAAELTQAVDRNNSIFAVTYNYGGYPMIKQARALVREGRLGKIRKVIVEYSQGWLARKIEDEGAKQAEWRTDPARSGIAGAIGDIGSHAENLAHAVTGLDITDICADLTTFVPGRRLDDDGNLLLRFENDARGILIASQISAGEENNLRLRVYGSEAGLEWHQENPNYLYFRPLDAPEQVFKRGNPYVADDASRLTRTPFGHPEAFFEAFANVYRNVTDTIRARIDGRQPTNQELDFPTVRDGARGVHFIEKTVESGQSDRKWLPARWPDPAASKGTDKKDPG